MEGARGHHRALLRVQTDPLPALLQGSLAHHDTGFCRVEFTAASPVPSHHPPPFSLGPKRRSGSHWRKGPSRPSRPAWPPWTPWAPGKTPHLPAQPRGKGPGFVCRVQRGPSGVSREGEAVSRAGSSVEELVSEDCVASGRKDKSCQPALARRAPSHHP